MKRPKPPSSADGGVGHAEAKDDWKPQREYKFLGREVIDPGAKVFKPGDRGRLLARQAIP